MAIDEQFLEFGGRPEMVEGEGPAGAEDEDDLLDAGTGQLLDDHLECRGIDDGEEFFGNDFGGGQHPSAHPSGHNHCLSYFHGQNSTDSAGVMQSL